VTRADLRNKEIIVAFSAVTQYRLQMDPSFSKEDNKLYNHHNKNPKANNKEYGQFNRRKKYRK
jgi:hypothetical protein